jgi:hypothetical protein
MSLIFFIRNIILLLGIDDSVFHFDGMGCDERKAANPDHPDACEKLPSLISQIRTLPSRWATRYHEFSLP